MVYQNSEDFWQAIKDAQTVDEKLDILFDDDYLEDTEEAAE